MAASYYSYESFYVDDNEYDTTYNECLGRQRKATASEDYEKYVPIKILCKTAGSTDYAEYGTIVRTSKTGYKFVSSDGTEVIDNVSSSNRVSFPEGTVQIKIQQSDSPFYESDVSMHFGIKIHATDHGQYHPGRTSMLALVCAWMIRRNQSARFPCA